MSALARPKYACTDTKSTSKSMDTMVWSDAQVEQRKYRKYQPTDDEVAADARFCVLLVKRCVILEHSSENFMITLELTVDENMIGRCFL